MGIAGCFGREGTGRSQHWDRQMKKRHLLRFSGSTWEAPCFVGAGTLGVENLTCLARKAGFAAAKGTCCH
jgi:hypothetical protein